MVQTQSSSAPVYPIKMLLTHSLPTCSKIQKVPPDLCLMPGPCKALADQTLGLGAMRVGLVLTPHAGEMAGLLGKDRSEIEADPAQYARDAADRFRAVVALKGAQT